MATIEVCYTGNGVFKRATFEDLPTYLEHESAFVWVDADGNDPEELAALQSQFRLHRLTVESALETEQRPRIMVYDDLIYLEFYGMRREGDDVHLDDIGIFVGPKFLITSRRGKHPSLDGLISRWRDNEISEERPEVTGHPRIPGLSRQERREPSSTMILYAILDDLVDDYFPIIDWFGEHIDALEDAVMDGLSKERQREVQQVRSELVRLGRAISPEQDVLNTLLRRDMPVVDEALLPYFADVYNHVMRIHDWIESYREQLTSIVDLQLATQSNNLNQTMRTMTASSIILMACSLITGFYGMNFTNFPSLHWENGIWYSIALMSGLSIGLLAIFRSRNWW